MKKFRQRADNLTRIIKEEIAAATHFAAATHSIDELAAQLTAIEQKLSQAVLSVKALEEQRQGLQNELAETQRGRSDVETRRGAMETAIEEKVGEAILSVKPLAEQVQSPQNELAKAQRRRGDVEIHLAVIEQKLSEGVTSVKMLEDQRQSLQNELAEGAASPSRRRAALDRIARSSRADERFGSLGKRRPCSDPDRYRLPYQVTYLCRRLAYSNICVHYKLSYFRRCISSDTVAIGSCYSRLCIS